MSMALLTARQIDADVLRKLKTRVPLQSPNEGGSHLRRFAHAAFEV